MIRIQTTLSSHRLSAIRAQLPRRYAVQDCGEKPVVEIAGRAVCRRHVESIGAAFEVLAREVRTLS